ncbi:FLJ37770-like protein [Trichonephila clavipes]|uniref:FLJ37770-like protein n=1 Tax=Trichonephila clavipes TaxID=2585209 RepID=A0A8X6UQH0_TRICX|nr:FLJ37770-like protein [Trichonephila clavipes]
MRRVILKLPRDDVEDNLFPDHSSTSNRDDSIGKIGNLVRSDNRLCIHTIVATVGIDKESIQSILHNTQKVCAKMMPIILIFEQETRKNAFTDTF